MSYHAILCHPGAIIVAPSLRFMLVSLRGFPTCSGIASRRQFVLPRKARAAKRLGQGLSGRRIHGGENRYERSFPWNNIFSKRSRTASRR
jgi:hypothetical protein